MDAAGEILASEHAKTILPQWEPERSFEEGSTTDGCKHGTLQACRELATDPGGGCSTRRQ